MSKPRFFKTELKEVKGNVLNLVYPQLKGTIYMPTMEERLGNGKCPDCDCNSWIMLPEESYAVREVGKPYIECMGCGYHTHL